MTGPEDSVLGVDIDLAVSKLRTHCPVTFKESSNPCFLNAVIVTFDEKNGRAAKIERLIVR